MVLAVILRSHLGVEGGGEGKGSVGRSDRVCSAETYMDVAT